MSRAAEASFWKLAAACSAAGTVAHAPIVVTVALVFRFSSRALIVPCLLLLAAGFVTAGVLFWARPSHSELPTIRVAVVSFVFIFSHAMAYLLSAGLLHLVPWVQVVALWLPLALGASVLAAWGGYHLPHEKWRYFARPGSKR